MPPLQSGDSGDEHGEDDDDPVEFRPLLPPDDRIWRHPSEVASSVASPTPAVEAVRSRMVAIAVLSALIGATSALGVAAALGGFGGSDTVVERNVAIQPVTSRSHDDDTVAAVTSRTSPAIVGLRIERSGETVAGSGIVFRSDGYLVTNSHLVRDADRIAVRMHGGAVADARLVGSDPSTDIAVLHVDVTDLVPAVMGTAEGLAPGDRAIAIGVADRGGWATDVTTCVIRGMDRKLRGPEGAMLHDMILVDTAVASATAGGPLLDIHGAVVGITGGGPATIPETGPGSDAEVPLGIATPIDVAVHVADQIIEHGRARHVWLGVEGADLAPDQASALGVVGGASVSRVVPASPAADAGLEAGDIVVVVDDRPIESMSDLIAALRTFEPSDDVTLVVLRGDERLDIVVALVERAAPSTNG